MLINYSWIISRRRILVSAIIDFIGIILLYNLNHFYKFGSSPNKYVTLSLAFFWIITSYIIGRYMIVKKLNKESIFRSFLKIIFIFILCNSIYFLINWGYILVLFFSKSYSFSVDLNKTLFNIFYETLILISLLSFLFQYLLSIITHKIYSYDDKWLFIGNHLIYNKIKKEIVYENKEIRLLFIPNNGDFKKINFKNIKGIIINNYSELNDINVESILELKLKGIRIITLLNWFDKVLNRIPTDITYEKFQLIEKIKSAEYNYQLRIKRMGDIIVSLFLIILLFPLFLVIGILIFFEDRKSIFYNQKRTGLNGKIINIIKFRSMKINAEKDGIQWSTKDDQRITKVGRFLRATRLDEIPQLFCVLRGDMSLIGPRPERPEIEEELLHDIPFYNYRKILKPGLSGWAQVNYSYGASVYDSSKKLSYDIYYIINFSFFLDLLILFKTIKTVFNLKGYQPN